MNMYVMRMHENDLEVENVSYSGRGVWVIYGSVALYDMPDNEWECMIMAENSSGFPIRHEHLCDENA